MTGPEDLGCEHQADVAAYLLGALEPDEAQEFQTHMRECAWCGREVAQLRGTVDALAIAPPRYGAPQVLSDRIMATVRSEAELLAAAGPEADRAQTVRPRWYQRRLTLIGGALAPVAAGVLAGLIIAGSGGGSTATRLVTADVTLPGATHASALVRETAGSTQLTVSRMPEPPAGKVYEVWLQRDGHQPVPTDALFSVTHDGSGSVAVQGSLHGAQKLLVTAEPVGGSLHPTSTPIIVADLHAV